MAEVNLGVANREVVIEGVEELRKTYEDFINKKQQEGYDFKFIDGQMIGHNFYKLLLFHIAEVSGVDKRFMIKIGIATLKKYLDNPQVSNETDPQLS
jgi:hypothetical protein